MPLFSSEIHFLSQIVPLWLVKSLSLSHYMLLVLYGLVLLQHHFCPRPPLGIIRRLLLVSKELNSPACYRATLPFMDLIRSKEGEKGEGMMEGCSVWQHGWGSPWGRERGHGDLRIDCRKKEDCEKNRIQWKSRTFCKQNDSSFQKHLRFPKYFRV